MRRSGLTAVLVVKFESSCCLMLAIDQLRRRRVTNKNLSKLLRGPGNGGIQAFFFFLKKTIQPSLLFSEITRYFRN